MNALADTYLEKLGLQVAGPLVTVIVGSLIVGLIVANIARRAQDQRADRALRIQLIDSIAKVSGAMYIRTQAYWRWKRQVTGEESEAPEMRRQLDLAYEAMQIDGASLEAQLTAYFVDPDIAEYWHSATDCLTIRYFTLLMNSETDLRKLYKINEKGNGGRTHSGLMADQMSERNVVVDMYTHWRDRTVAAVADRAMRRPV